MASIRQRRGLWEVRYWGPDGKQHSKSFRTYNLAKAYRSEVETDLNRGRWRNPKPSRIAFEEYAREYLDEAHTFKRPTTVARDVTVTEKYLIPKFGRSQLVGISRRDVSGFIAEMIHQGLAPKTIRTIIGVLRVILSSAVEREIIYHNPCSNISRSLPPDTRRPIRYLDAGELNRLAGAMPPQYRALIFVLGVMGLRWSELVGLRVGDINFLQRTMRIETAITEVNGKLVKQGLKTEASRATLSVPPVVIEELAQHLAVTGRTDPADLVFASPAGGPLRATNFRNRIWQPAVDATGLTGLRPHGLRHSAAGLLIQLGAHPKLVQQRMRHASIRTTFDVYGSVLPSLDEAVVTGLDGLIQDGRPKDECGEDVGQMVEGTGAPS